MTTPPISFLFKDCFAEQLFIHPGIYAKLLHFKAVLAI